MKFTKGNYTKMTDRCKGIASAFIDAVSIKRALLDPENNIDDIDKFEVPQDEIIELFEQFRQAMGLKCELGFFRDNDEECGRYSEHMDAISLPLCIGYENGRIIVKHMMHELFHAFQYAAICEPSNYTCFKNETIKKWAFEFSNYISGALDMKNYRAQDIEQSAEEFGKMIAGI